MSEVWKPLPGYEGRYEVSNTGRVWGFYRNREMKQATDKAGYKYAHIYSHLTGGKKRKIHHLVLETFVEVRPEGTECCHNDGCQSNNNLQNLRWDSRKSNMNDKKMHGTYLHGETANRAKLTKEDIPKIFELSKSGWSTQKISDCYSVDKSAIKSILRGKSWSHLNIEPICFYWRPEFRTENHYLRALEFIIRVSDGERISHVAKTFGIDTKNAYRDYKKFVKNVQLVKGRLP